MTVCEDVKHLKGEMRALMEATLKEGVEHGVYICEKDGKYVFGETCKGKECAVKIRNCKGGEIVGAFHTHPLTYTKEANIAFSTNDLLVAYHSSDIAERPVFECVGSKNVVRCIETPEDEETREKALRTTDNLVTAMYLTFMRSILGMTEKVEEDLSALYQRLKDDQAEILKPCEFSV